MTEKPNDEPQVSNEADVEAHASRGRAAPAQPAETEAHLARSGRRTEEDLPTGQQETERENASDDGPDVEGHAARFKG